MMIPKRLFLLTVPLLVVSCTPDLPPSSTLALRQVTINSRELHARFSGKIVRAARNKPHLLPFMNGTPTHLRFVFDDYHLSKSVQYREPQLLLYPIEAYRELFRNAPSEQRKLDNDIGVLKRLIISRADNAAGMIPVLPPVEALQLFCSQIRHLDFAGGSGVRFITRYTMEPSPTTNENIFYTFQGLTTDGRYYISAFFPITANGLPETPVTLATINFLNRLTPAGFTPDLAWMDDIIESLQFGGTAALDTTCANPHTSSAQASSPRIHGRGRPN